MSMEATAMYILINEINNQDTVNISSFIKIFGLKQGINKFGQKVYEEAYGEILQLHQIKCFISIILADYNPIERKYH